MLKLNNCYLILFTFACIFIVLDDLNNFFGLVSLIIQSPYDDDSIFAWDSSGNTIPLSINDEHETEKN